ncbi:MAG: hypothetical protein Q6362_011605, partial [Candidatus Wukongarchaeota archaeon]|nr:hypothetical protein [Candidatus Wukongarchaeota archaeon]
MDKIGVSIITFPLLSFSKALQKIEEFFRELAPKMRPSHAPVSSIDPGILRHQIPGGMISNLKSQLEQQSALDKLYEVLDEVPRVREDL